MRTLFDRRHPPLRSVLVSRGSAGHAYAPLPLQGGQSHTRKPCYSVEALQSRGKLSFDLFCRLPPFVCLTLCRYAGAPDQVIFRARRIVDYIYARLLPACPLPYPRQHSTMFLTWLVCFAPYYSSFIANAGKKCRVFLFVVCGC